MSATDLGAYLFASNVLIRANRATYLNELCYIARCKLTVIRESRFISQENIANPLFRVFERNVDVTRNRKLQFQPRS